MTLFKSKKNILFLIIFIVVILTVAIVFLFNSGILNDSIFNNLNYKAGNFDGTKYENKSIGISMYLPKDWVVNDKEMLLMLADPNYHTLSDEEKSIYDAKEIISTYDFAAYKNDGVTSMTVSVDNVSLINKEKKKLSLNEYIDSLKSGKTGRDVSLYTFDDKTSSMIISGRKYTRLSAHFTEAETINTYFIFASRGDYYVMVTFTFNETQKDEIDNIIKNNFE